MKKYIIFICSVIFTCTAYAQVYTYSASQNDTPNHNALFKEYKDLFISLDNAGTKVENFKSAIWEPTRIRVERNDLIPLSVQVIESKGLVWSNNQTYSNGTPYGALLTSTLNAGTSYSLTPYDPNVSVFTPDPKELKIESTSNRFYGVCFIAGGGYPTELQIILDKNIDRTVTLGALYEPGNANYYPKKTFCIIDTDGFESFVIKPKPEFLESGVQKKVVHIWGMVKLLSIVSATLPDFNPPVVCEAPSYLGGDGLCHTDSQPNEICGPDQIIVYEDEGPQCEDL